MCGLRADPLERVFTMNFGFYKLIFAGLVATSFCIAAYGQAPTRASRYLDPVSGSTADQAVGAALDKNDELQAARKEVDAFAALVRQAGLRPNPKVALSGAKQISGMDNNQMAEVMLPLELGGRRAARIAVAEREFEARRFELDDRERLLAADVRLKYGEALAAVKRLDLAERDLAAAKQAYDLIVERVADGKSAPLEQNVMLVEVNRLRSLVETAEGKADVAMFELRSLMGMRPEEPLRLRGSLGYLIQPLPPLDILTDRALSSRPDLSGARALERLASAKIEMAKADGRADMSVKGGYQRMRSGYMLSGYDDHGMLRPIADVMHFFTFGVEIDLPVRDRNQGAVAASEFDRIAAERRVAFGELTIRREVASAAARYNSAARSLSIMQNGVRDQGSSNLAVIWQTYEMGRRSLLEYIAEQRRFLEIENELIDAELETFTATVELLKATNSSELRGK